VVFK